LARELSYIPSNLNDETGLTRHRILQQLIASDAENEKRTSISAIHDAVLGRSDVSLKDCISLLPHYISTLDDLGFAPLHLAVLTNNLDAVHTLASLGADLNQPTGQYGETPLHLACFHNHEMIGMALLDLGASIHALDKNGRTTLHACNAAPGMARRLLHLGVDPAQRTYKGTTPFRGLVKSWSLPNPQRVETLKVYAEAGVDIGEVFDGWPSLISATCCAAELVQPLLELGAKPGALCENGQSLLHILPWNPKGIHLVRKMPVALLRGLDPDVVSSYGETALDMLEQSIADKGSVPNLFRPSLGEAVSFVEVILKLRELNWKEGLFLDSKERLEGDGSHYRLWRWVREQRQLFELEEQTQRVKCDPPMLKWHEHQDGTNAASSDETDVKEKIYRELPAASTRNCDAEVENEDTSNGHSIAIGQHSSTVRDESLKEEEEEFFDAPEQWGSVPSDATSVTNTGPNRSSG